jgi:hypothetical protein
MKYIILLLLAITFSGCELIDREIDPEIQPFVDQFYMEARSRGLDLDVPNMKIQFKNIKGKETGRCNMVFKTIYIDKESIQWKYNPECLVFHELGHLILKRNHRNDVINKYCLSIMSNQDDPIYDTHIGDRLYDRRTYYIDELFNPKTEIPDWISN